MRKFNIDNFIRLKKDSGLNNASIVRSLSHAGVDITIDAVKSWTRSSKPSDPELSTIRALSILFGVPMSELDNDIKRDVDLTLKAINNDNFVMVDHIDLRAGAGSEGIINEYIHKRPIPITKQLLNGTNPENLVILQVVGDSMQPTIMPDEFIIVDKVNNREFFHVDGMYLINKDGTIQIKRLHFKGIKGIDIISDNNIYPKENTIDHNIDLEIIGKLFKQIKNLGALAVKK